MQPAEPRQSISHLQPRPYFIPPTVKLEDLPPRFMAAYTDIIEPAYVEFVLCAKTVLHRMAGMSLVFFLYLEVVEQLDLGRLMNQSGLPTLKDPVCEKSLTRLFRSSAAKMHAASFLARLDVIRNLGTPAPSHVSHSPEAPS